MIPIVLGASLLVTVVAFWASWRVLPEVWAQSRGHGLFAVLLSATLLWRERHRIGTGYGTEPGALVALGALSLLWLVGVVISAQVIHLSTVPLVLLAWAAAVFGWRSLVPLVPAAAAFSLALPIWEVLIWPLQMATVLVNRLLLAITPFNAEIDGTSIHLPAGTLVVADSCAGLNFLMASLLIGTAYAMFFENEWRTRWRLIGIAAAIAIVANWIRVFGLVVIADVTSMQSGLIEDHAIYGWVIFAASMGAYFVFAERAGKAPQTSGESPTDVSATGAEPAAVTHAPLSLRAAVVAATAACFAVLGPTLLRVADARRMGTPLLPVPSLIGAAEWSSRTIDPSAQRWQPGFTGADEHMSVEWVDGSDTVRVDRFVYRDQRQGHELIGGSNAIAAPRDLVADRIVGPLDASLRMVREAAIRERAQRNTPAGTPPVPGASVGQRSMTNPTDPPALRLVWYWYRVADAETPSPTRAKLLELLAFVRRSSPSEVIVASAPCEGADCAAAQARLRRLVGGRWASGPTTP